MRRNRAQHLAILAIGLMAGLAQAEPAPPARPASTPAIKGPPGAALHNAAEPGAGAFGAMCGADRPCSAGLSCTEGRCKPGEIKLDLQWVRLEGGSFVMGVAHTRGGDANPPRGVKVPTFDLSRTEVTVAQYRLCMAAGKCTAPVSTYNCNLGAAEREQHPMNCVKWDQAQAFAAFVGGRLPSEAEWEFAATSGGKDQPWPWGGGAIEPQHAVAALARTDADPESTAPVCSKPAGNSAQGLCDLMGNVSEWLADGYGPYGEAPSDGSARADMPAPKASDGCEKCVVRSGRVHRGGNWASQPQFLQANSRDATMPDDPHNTLGFRVARTVK